MLKFIRLQDIKAGKKIKAIEAHCDWCCIVFNDGTFTTIEAGIAYEHPYLHSENDIHLDRSNSGPPGGRYPEVYIELGVFGKYEYEAANREYERTNESRSREYKLQQYHQLRKELGFDAEAQP